MLAAARPPVATAVPDFEALAKVQDKITADTTLAALGIPEPRSLIVASQFAANGWDCFPAYRKVPIGTATVGVTLVRSRAELAWEGDPFLLQEPVEGTLVMAQSMFDRGRLVAAAANLRVREGARGGASHKRSIDLPTVREHLDRLGRHLGWHGAMSADVILGADGPKFIDVNPRLVEPGNAWRAGVDLVGALLDLALGRTPPSQPAGRENVNTHQFILAVLGAVQAGRSRHGILQELVGVARHGGQLH